MTVASTDGIKRGERTTKKLAVAAVAAIALIGALALAMGSLLVAPAPAVIPDSALALPHETVSFASKSGSLIHGWYVPGSGNQGVVVLMHGIRGNRLNMIERAMFLHEAGYATLLFDFQAHGESPGKRITLGHLESLDAEAAVAYARHRCPGAPIGAVGVSLGGAAALLGPRPLAVQALVLEAVYSNIQAATENRLAMRLGPLGRLLSPLLLLQLEPRLGISPDELSPQTGIEHVTAPVFIIAGATDLHTTLADSQLLFDAAHEPKSIWVIPGAAHVDFAAFAGHQYQEKLLAFLGRYLLASGS